MSYSPTQQMFTSCFEDLSGDSFSALAQGHFFPGAAMLELDAVPPKSCLREELVPGKGV